MSFTLANPIDHWKGACYERWYWSKPKWWRWPCVWLAGVLRRPGNVDLSGYHKPGDILPYMGRDGDRYCAHSGLLTDGWECWNGSKNSVEIQSDDGDFCHRVCCRWHVFHYQHGGIDFPRFGYSLYVDSLSGCSSGAADITGVTASIEGYRGIKKL